MITLNHHCQLLFTLFCQRGETSFAYGPSRTEKQDALSPNRTTSTLYTPPNVPNGLPKICKRHKGQPFQHRPKGRRTPTPTAADVSMPLVHSSHSTLSSGAGSDQVISACTICPFSRRFFTNSASIFFIKKLGSHSRHAQAGEQKGGALLVRALR